MVERIFTRLNAVRLLAAPYFAVSLAMISNPAVADTDPTLFAGCYLLELSPVKSGSVAEKLLPKEFELRLEGEEKSSGRYSLIPSSIREKGRNIPGSWIMRGGWVKLRWGDGYSFLQVDLKREGEVLRGRAGTWSDDGGLDKWTNTAVATRTQCIRQTQSKSREITIQPIPTSSANHPRSDSAKK